MWNIYVWSIPGGERKKFRFLKNFGRLGQFRAYEGTPEELFCWIKSVLVIFNENHYQVMIFARFDQNLVRWFSNAFSKKRKKEDKKVNVFLGKGLPGAKSRSHWITRICLVRRMMTDWKNAEGCDYLVYEKWIL